MRAFPEGSTTLPRASPARFEPLGVFGPEHAREEVNAMADPCKACPGLGCEECVAQALALPEELVLELAREGLVLPLC